MTKNNFTVTYTNKDIMDKLEDIDDKLHDVHSMAKVTNGSVKFHTKLIWGAYGFTFAVMILLLKLFINCAV